MTPRLIRLTRVAVPALLSLGCLAGAQVPRDLVVPAGTLLQCTMDEPNFSSATASPGDPFLCYPKSLQEFGQTVFPRGAYLVGHMEAAKDPGRLLGKGYMQLTIDRLGLPAADIPFSAKVITVAGYRVDRDGKILGNGHATRDVLEWMLPPLWPWKLVMLPARGPRPAMKGEVRVTMRIMDDFSVPQISALAPAASSFRPQSPVAPAPNSTPKLLPGYHSFGSSLQPTALQTPVVKAWAANVTLLQTRDGVVLPVSRYERQQDELVFELAVGGGGRIPVNGIDWTATAHLNGPRNVRVTLHSAENTEQ